MKTAAFCVIFNTTHDQILLVQRRDVPLWTLPGGGIDAGETPEIAVVREALEETGLQVTIVRKIGEYTPINRLAAETHLFECLVKSGDLSKSSETRDVCFFSINSLPKEFFELHRLWVDDALRNELQIIRKPLSQVTYWASFKYFLQHPIHIIKYLTSRFIRN